MINNVVLVGRLTRDPDLRYTSSGLAVATFTLAVDRRFTNQAGERETDFIQCVIWRKSAETLANYTRKGSLIGVEGRIQTRNYENQQGQRVYVTEVLCDSFHFLESKATNEQRLNNQSYGSNSGNQQFNQSFNQSSNPSQNSSSNTPDFGRDADPFASSSQIDISDDDLPF